MSICPEIQESISVGCVPPAAVAVKGGSPVGDLPAGGSPCKGVSLMGDPPVDRQTPVKT